MRLQPVLLAVAGLLIGTSLSAQIKPTTSQNAGGLLASTSAISHVDANTLRSEFLVLREAFEAQADALAHGLLPTRLDFKTAAAARPAAGGGGAVGALGTITSAFGPLSNSVSSLTFERDPTLSNGTSETFAMIGLGSAVVGGVLNLIGGGGGAEVSAAASAENRLAASVDGFMESQRAAERLIDQLERLSEDAESLISTLHDGAPGSATLSSADAILRRGERAILRFDYVTRTAVSQLAMLRAGAKGDDAGRLAGIEAAEVRFHQALDGVREVGVAAAFARITELRAQLDE